MAQKKLLSNLEAHRLLYCLVQLRYLPERYSIPGYLHKFHTIQWDDFLSRDIRDMAIEQARRNTCNFCDTPISPNSTGDHLIPKTGGGMDGMPNYIAMCRSHNSSKGAKDLLEWFQFKGWALEQCPVDVLCMYTRLRFKLCKEQNTLEDPAPQSFVNLLRDESLNYDTKDRRAIFRSAGII